MSCRFGRLLLCTQRFEGAIDEPAEVPAIDVLVRGFAGGVVAAGQNARLKVDAEALEGFDDLERVLARKGQVVVGVDQEDFLIGAAGLGSGKSVVVAAWG